jgi:DNA helicase-2/ATP-dependent DNA helicase PcrA
LEQIQDEASQHGVSLWSAMLERCGSQPLLPAGVEGVTSSGAGRVAPQQAKKGVGGFIAVIESMRDVCEKLPLPEVVEHIVEHSGLAAYYRAERDGADRL